MMKLDDLLFTQGFGTRYDCRNIIAAGAIAIKGEIHDDPDEEVEPEGLVFTYRGVDWPYCEKALIALNKPAGYECSMKPSAYPSVMNLLPGQLRARHVQPIGRLDADTTGLLLLTDDGALLHRLTHPKRHVRKVYEVKLKHPAAEDLVDRLLSGVVLADDPKPISAEMAEIVDDQRLQLRMMLTQGKYHQVKRMVAACGNCVLTLHRSAVGAYRLPDDLAPGQWCWLKGADEVLGVRG